MCQNGKETQVRYFQTLLPGFQSQDGLPARNGILRFDISMFWTFDDVCPGFRTRGSDPTKRTDVLQKHL